ncbi:hypothetical protein EV1_003830 [Malus domestica]
MAGSSSSGEIRTPIFSGVNYDFWRTKLRTIFVSHDLWSLIEDGYVVPPSNVVLTETQTRELKVNIKRDAKAFGVIQNAISDEIFPRISNETSAKLAWDVLEKVYRGSTKVRAVKLQSLRRDFEYIRMKDDELLDDYLSRLSEIINQMKSYGEILSDERIVQKYLISLPRKYDNIVSIIEETKDLSTLSVEELIGSLKGFAQRLSRHDNNDVENAFQTLTVNPKTQASSSQSKANFNKNWKGKNKAWEGKGNFEDKKKVEKSLYVSKCKICDKAHSGECWFKGKVKCHKCSKFGHMQKDCTYKDNQLAHYTKAEDEETNMFYVGHDTTVQEEAKVWFVDSGCSNHMTANKNILHNVDTTNLTRVKMGNGQLVDTLGRGTIAVHTKNGKMFIKDVMLVPDLKQNLLSLGQLIEHGYYLYFGDNTCKIYDRRNRQQLVAKIEIRKSRSFPLTIEYATQSAFKMEVQEDSKLWHKRLGHLNFQSLKKLQEKEMVHGLPSIQENEEICEGWVCT